MLLKNFGVTRHGRVVFYDYDEIEPLLDCNFRRIPPPRDEMDEMSDKPWYSVGPKDIFPEEFRLFFSGNARARAAFDAQHADLYDATTGSDSRSSSATASLKIFIPIHGECVSRKDSRWRNHGLSLSHSARSGVFWQRQL